MRVKRIIYLHLCYHSILVDERLQRGILSQKCSGVRRWFIGIKSLLGFFFFFFCYEERGIRSSGSRSPCLCQCERYEHQANSSYTCQWTMSFSRLIPNEIRSISAINRKKSLRLKSKLKTFTFYFSSDFGAAANITNYEMLIMLKLSEYHVFW